MLVMDRVPSPKLYFQMPGFSWIRSFFKPVLYKAFLHLLPKNEFLYGKTQEWDPSLIDICLISILLKSEMQDFCLRFFLNKVERGIMHYIFSGEKVSICGVKNRWWNSLKMHKTSRILLFLVSSQVRFDRLLQPEGATTRENLLLFALSLRGWRKLPLLIMSLKWWRRDTKLFPGTLGPDHVLV